MPARVCCLCFAMCNYQEPDWTGLKEKKGWPEEGRDFYFCKLFATWRHPCYELNPQSLEGSSWEAWKPAGKQVLDRRWKSGDRTDKQSFPLILFLDVVYRCSVRAINHATYFAQTDYPLVCGYCHGIWCRPVRTFSSKSFPVFPSALASPPLSFLTLHPPSTLPRVCHAVTFSQRAHSDLVHRQSCCCVGGCVRACTYFSFLPTRSLCPQS